MVKERSLGARAASKRGCLPCPEVKWFHQEVDDLPPIALKCRLQSFTTRPPCRCVYNCGIAGKKDVGELQSSEFGHEQPKRKMHLSNRGNPLIGRSIPSSL